MQINKCTVAVVDVLMICFKGMIKKLDLPNLFLIELMFKWPRMIRFRFLLPTSLILLKEILLTNLEGSLDLQ